MNKLLLMVIFFLFSCSSNNLRNDLIFPDNLNFNEFKLKLEEYTNSNPYPNIDY